MFPLEQAILVLALVAIILISYAILLAKLKSPEEESHPKNLTEKGRPTKKYAHKKENLPKHDSTKRIAASKHIGNAKGTESKKSFFLYGEGKFAGCLHEFGYLGETVPTSVPIPDECFGCPRLIECHALGT